MGYAMCVCYHNRCSQVNIESARPAELTLTQSGDKARPHHRCALDLVKHSKLTVLSNTDRQMTMCIISRSNPKILDRVI